MAAKVTVSDLNVLFNLSTIEIVFKILFAVVDAGLGNWGNSGIRGRRLDRFELAVERRDDVLHTAWLGRGY